MLHQVLTEVNVSRVSSQMIATALTCLGFFPLCSFVLSVSVLLSAELLRFLVVEPNEPVATLLKVEVGGALTMAISSSISVILALTSCGCKFVLGEFKNKTSKTRHSLL